MARAMRAGDRSARWRAAALALGLGMDHSPPLPKPLFGLISLNLPSTRGRTSARQLYSSSLSWYSMTWRFSSTTRISCNPVANSRVLGLQRPDHGNLVQADADASAGGVVQPRSSSAWRVVAGLAAGDDAEAVVRALDHVGLRRLARM